jgi:hypothetical protein
MADPSNNDLEVARSIGGIEATQTQILDELRNIRTDLAAHVKSDAKTFEEMKADANKAKGAGWAILGLLGSVATFLGGAVIAALGGWIKIHW